MSGPVRVGVPRAELPAHQLVENAIKFGMQTSRLPLEIEVMMAARKATSTSKS